MTMHERLPSIPAEQADIPSPFAADIRPAQLADAVNIQVLNQSIIREYFPDAEAAAKVAAIYPLGFWQGAIENSFHYGRAGPGATAMVTEPDEAFDYLFRVAAVDDDIVGFATLNAVHHELPTVSVYIRADWRRRGLGRRMFNNIMHAAYQRRMFIIRLDVLEQQVGFFERMGCVLEPNAEVFLQTFAEEVTISIRPMVKLIGSGSAP